MKPQVDESSGATLVGRIRAELATAGLEPDAKENELLSIAEALQDRILELERAIRDEGLTSVSKSGVVHLHPAVAEARQTRGVLARTLAAVQMHDDSKDATKQRAAQASWQARKRTRGFPA